MSYFYQDSVFWVEVDKIEPNPYQPRREFNEEELQSLANSIRQYGVLQALVVTRQELPKEDGGLSVKYELISGERRLRAAKLASVKQVPVLIRSGEESDLMKLELAIIENLQREDLNVVERAKAFDKLAKKFTFNKTQIAKKVGKSREYVSNTMRILTLPEEILDALSMGRLSEGHARPLLMLSHRPEEQITLFKEVMYKKSSVRETERIAKKIAKEKVRKPTKVDPELEMLEKEFTESLGTRVNIESKEVGGKISIDYFSQEDLLSLLEILKLYKKQGNAPMLENFLAQAAQEESEKEAEAGNAQNNETVENNQKETVSLGVEYTESKITETSNEDQSDEPAVGAGEEQDISSEKENVPEAETQKEPEKVGIWERISSSFYSRAEDEDAKIYRENQTDRPDENESSGEDTLTETKTEEEREAPIEESFTAVYREEVSLNETPKESSYEESQRVDSSQKNESNKEVPEEYPSSFSNQEIPNQEDLGPDPQAESPRKEGSPFKESFVGELENSQAEKEEAEDTPYDRKEEIPDENSKGEDSEDEDLYSVRNFSI